ncbi:MAG: glycosyltransferase family 1 protein, partial [Chloroflexus aggregans]
RAAIGTQPGERVVLYVGRVAAEKRVDLLPEAIRGLPNVRLVIVGDGPFRAELQRRCVGLPVRFTGYLKGEALAVAYASADAFVFPSDTDTFGQVIQEAMASGLPVVAARAGGAIDLVRHGYNGYLFTPGVVTDLRARLRELLANDSRRITQGLAGRVAAERRSWPSVMDELMGYYTRAMSHRRLGRRPG